MIFQVARLLKNGVTMQEAWAMSPARRLAFVVALGEIDGAVFDWEMLRWRDAPP